MNHAEAFKLMTYQCEKVREHREVIWNSRNGVTPFLVGCRSCNGQMQHIDFQRDVYSPGHKPKPGDRIFTDLTEERIEEKTKEWVEMLWNHPEFPLKASYESKPAAAVVMAKQLLVAKQHGEGDLITVQRCSTSLG
jgi:hypothetical protein